ncbi:MAG: hypothetical protein M5R41_10305 [Bacteroidia bacterium]|nr:hypothetical protein [Bacteroidia bacterium]
MFNRDFHTLSKAQIRNLLQGGSQTSVVENVTIVQQVAQAVIIDFEDAESMLVIHPGPHRWVQVTIYNTDHYQLPPERIASIHYGHETTDPDNPYYYVAIVFHQPESGIVRVTL